MTQIVNSQRVYANQYRYAVHAGREFFYLLMCVSKCIWRGLPTPTIDAVPAQIFAHKTQWIQRRRGHASQMTSTILAGTLSTNRSGLVIYMHSTY